MPANFEWLGVVIVMTVEALFFAAAALTFGWRDYATFAAGATVDTVCVAFELRMGAENHCVPLLPGFHRCVVVLSLSAET